MSKEIVRSPFFYVGDKYKLMPQLQELFPKDITTYIEPFAGGGSSFLNTRAKKYIVNDVDTYVVALHRYLSSYAGNTEEFLSEVYSIIDKYKLSCSFRNITVPDSLKKQYVKTYYSRFNKEAYSKLKRDFNKNQDLLYLYVLLIYGFNHMIRFNTSGEFNLPVGNVDFNKNVYKAICNYMEFMRTAKIEFYNLDFEEFINNIRLTRKSYVYFDPPYLISGSEYNKLWNEEEELRLCALLDRLNRRGIRFGITNLINHKGKTNNIFLEWSQQYFAYNISSNYISFNDNTIKPDSKEVFVTNYGQE